MKKSIPEYITTLSDNNFDILEEIFLHKYKKMMTLYWMISDYSDFISELKYKDTDKDILKIELHLAGKIKIDEVMKNIEGSIGNENILVKNTKKVIYIEITKDEEVEG